MGQLEKYGLYVLCLVIFLILGVAIWGGGELPRDPQRPGGPPASELKARIGGASAARPAEAALPPDLEALLRPVERGKPESKAPPKAEPKTEPAGGSKNGPAAPPRGAPADASAGKGGAADQPPAVPPAPAADAARKTHKIRSGDSFESIARQLFGDGALRVEIARLNPRLEPTRLKPGQELLLPTAAEVQQALDRRRTKAAPAAAASPGTYLVAVGDTFEGIATRVLGSRKRVAELQEANPGVDPRALKAGSLIKLPRK